MCLLQQRPIYVERDIRCLFQKSPMCVEKHVRCLLQKSPTCVEREAPLSPAKTRMGLFWKRHVSLRKMSWRTLTADETEETVSFVKSATFMRTPLGSLKRDLRDMRETQERDKKDSRDRGDCFFCNKCYGVAMISRLLKIMGLFCRISSLL